MSIHLTGKPVRQSAVLSVTWAVASLCAASLVGVAAPAGATWVSGYYVGYQRDLYPPDVVNYSAMTHLIVGRVVPSSNGTLNTTFDTYGGEALAEDLVTRAKAAGTIPILMVGGAGTHDAFLSAASEANRPTFVNNLVTWAQSHGFAGLDLDWEPINPSDQPVLLALIQSLRGLWTDAVLTIPVNFVNPNLAPDVSFFGTIAPYMDQINIMTYLMLMSGGGWYTWHNSALDGAQSHYPTSISNNVDIYLRAVPPEKLGIGIPFFGACLTPPASAPRQNVSFTVAATDNDMSYTNIVSSYYTSAAHYWDDAAKSPYLSFSSATGPRGCGMVSYDDPQSIAERGAFVKSKGIGGTIIWTINQGYLPNNPPGQRDPMMDAIKAAFLSDQPPPTPSISVNDTSVTEGQAGTNTLSFEVLLSP